MPFTHTIPAEGVRGLRSGIRGRLAVAQQQVEDAGSHGERAEGRAHLTFVRDLLDVLGWEDREPEVDVPVEPVRAVLRKHLAKERELADTHDEDQRERAEVMVQAIEHMLRELDDAS